ncbi:sugar porter family MFS transporter [Sinomicrobium soli]|uniref:sugar porter family MFS transporter n=1 Tax=Sinomicrobium sp. N-1-3-6 TaxID=2219864 RepID=UPI000DCB0B75|nr:sugar porter family MFS transporter [Sinomicrobium sp. N-1-3-6]RAV27738.1 MFS transporter [Sinomicrobium sp. N-1-3-6]
MKIRLFYYALVVALAGFLFGFDTVVISGANMPIKALWPMSDWFHGTFIMSMALWGTVAGALLGGYPTDILGRKNTLIVIGVLYFVSALGSAIAAEPYIFSFYRFIGGLGVGASSIAAPAYISEISRPDNRGKLGVLYQFNIVLGILIAYLSNYFLKGFDGANDWRWMLGVEAIPALCYTVLMFGVPRSPRWLAIHKGNEKQALKALEKTCGREEAVRMLGVMHDDHVRNTGTTETIFAKKYRFPLVLAFLIAVFNQFSGINFILYYAPEILQKAGFGSSESLFSSVSIGVVNLVFTFLGMYLIDRMGRRQLMLFGSAGYIISLFSVALCFYTGASAIYKLVFILLFIASHAVGQGSVIWVFISEIFPSKVRAYGQSWGSATHWVCASLVTLFGAVLINKFSPEVVFSVFGGLMVLQLLFVIRLMPETKGKSLEELEEQFIK